MSIAVPIQLRLNSIENTRKAYTKIIRGYWGDLIPADKARNMAYLLNGLLGYWKLEADLRIEERIAALEEVLDGRRKVS